MFRHEKLDCTGSNPNSAIYCVISMTQFPHLYYKNFNIGLPSHRKIENYSYFRNIIDYLTTKLSLRQYSLTKQINIFAKNTFKGLTRKPDQCD